ncbi:MAG: S8 family serine peptidase [Candidatus Eisenbacteria bacterium]|nr:S8 family serine peptidase [Candidatus Eisenbacteria bacterium]
MRRTLTILTTVLLLAAGGNAGAADLKLDAGLQALRHHGAFQAATAVPVAFAPGRPPVLADPDRISCWIRGSVSRTQLLALGIPAGTEAGGCVAADLTWDDIARVSALPGVELIQLSRRARPLLDSSRVATGASVIHGGTPPNYTGTTGRNVVVGVVDTGIDWTHADFKDNTGANRILFIWDQTVTGSAPSGFAYGTEWNAGQIQGGSCTEMDYDGHGTHVTSTAAGSGRATGNGKANYRYIGMAPEADIIFVKTDFTFAHIVDGVNYIFQKAAGLGKAAVVNLSLGSNYGPRDGTDPNELALNALTGPGKMVCVAAGNSGADSIHAEVDLVSGDSAKVTFYVPPYSANGGSTNDYVVLDAYYKVGDTIAVRVNAPNGYSTPSVVLRQIVGVQSTGSQGYIYVDNGGSVGNPLPNGQYNLALEVYDSDALKPPGAGTWTVTLYGTHIHSGGHVDLWLAESQLGSLAPLTPLRQGYTPSKEISTPSTAESTLCVAAYTTKRSWQVPSGSTYAYSPLPPMGQIADFSSRGPTSDGRMRPNIAAPGYGVAAARSSAISVGNWMADDSVHFMDQGTSMATPHVVGVVALVLQGHATIPPARIKLAIQGTAVADAFTGAVPNATWGWGKLSAQAVNSSTPVELFALEGAELPEGFEISWEVSEGLIYQQFRVSRAAALTGPWTDLTPRPLPGEARRFVDRPAAGLWFYRVEGTRAGHTEALGPFRAEVSGVGLASLRLLPPVPNPFQSGTRIRYVMPRAGQAEVSVYDIAGRRVARLFSGPVGPGRHDAEWDGSLPSGARAGAGLYLVKLRTDAGTLTCKITFLR